MKTNIFTLVLSFTLIFITSCSSDSNDDVEPIPDAADVTYTNTAKEIIGSNCTASACHDNSSPAAGLSLTTFAGVKGAFQNNGALAQIESGAMPKNANNLSTATINKLKGWIANNYKE